MDIAIRFFAVIGILSTLLGCVILLVAYMPDPSKTKTGKQLMQKRLDRAIIEINRSDRR